MKVFSYRFNEIILSFIINNVENRGKSFLMNAYKQFVKCIYVLCLPMFASPMAYATISGKSFAICK